jgi:hypothetical protein
VTSVLSLVQVAMALTLVVATVSRPSLVGRRWGVISLAFGALWVLLLIVGIIESEPAGIAIGGFGVANLVAWRVTATRRSA